VKRYVLDHMALTAGLTVHGSERHRREMSRLLHDALEGGPTLAVPAVCLAASTASVAAHTAAAAVAEAAASAASPGTVAVMAEAAAAVAGGGARAHLAAHIGELLAAGPPGAIEVSELIRTTELDDLRQAFPGLDWPAVHAVIQAVATEAQILTTSVNTYAGVHVEVFEL
jgi:hypothetical protein